MNRLQRHFQQLSQPDLHIALGHDWLLQLQEETHEHLFMGKLHQLLPHLNARPPQHLPTSTPHLNACPPQCPTHLNSCPPQLLPTSMSHLNAHPPQRPISMPYLNGLRLLGVDVSDPVVLLLMEGDLFDVVKDAEEVGLDGV